MRNFLLLAFASLILFSGCETIYGPAISGSNMPYQARSAYHGENAKGTWVSGSFHQGITYGNANEENTLLQGSIHQSYTQKNFKATMGAYGFGGSYANIPSVEDLSFLGLGARGSISLNLPTEKVDFNLIGVQVGLNGEFGSYNKFRSGRDVYPGPFNTTMNLTTGFDIKGEHSSFGLEYAIGLNGMPLSIHYTNQKFSIWSQVNIVSIGEGYIGKSIWGIGAGFKL